MMILSVIIVNYNVKYFLEQCLCSVNKAIGQCVYTSGRTEIFVVDNASSDDSIEYLAPRFPTVHFIESKENMGFSRANNLALSRATGEFVLFLNPDTVVAEDCFDACIAFLNVHPQAGALGVRMIDGNGIYLKESKRGFPSPATAFYKLSGLAALFPHSKLFAAYYMGQLDEHETNPVDILSGAFMMIKMLVLHATGGFDEQFFMYAEDIDLSYRIIKSGYSNYYLGSTTIIHYKGESTKKDRRYVRLFYKAMSQFMKKHLSGGSFFFIFFMNLAIGVRELITATMLFFLRPAVKKADFIPITDMEAKDFSWKEFISGMDKKQE